MTIVNVKAVEGRVAYTRPSGGKRIPTNGYTTTEETPWIKRLADVHGDIEIVPIGELENKKERKPRGD